jgi:hypothetical protein
MNQRLWKTQDWGLLPHVVHSTVATARMVSGPCPFQIFPQLLGKNSRRGKHRRLLEDVGRIRRRSVSALRLEEVEPIQRILLGGLANDMKGTIRRMDAMKLTRDHVMENIAENLFSPVELSTKVKSAFTREYNKSHTVMKKRKEKEEEEEELEEEMENLEIMDE